jgi:hypothetical protein
VNLQYEWLQEIVVRTEKGNLLRLHLGNVSQQFRLYGEFYESSTEKWSLVDFPSQRIGDCNKLLENCLKTFSISLGEYKDKISALENPCNAPFISGAQQQAIVQQLGLMAKVSVN